LREVRQAASLETLTQAGSRNDADAHRFALIPEPAAERPAIPRFPCPQAGSSQRTERESGRAPRSGQADCPVPKQLYLDPDRLAFGAVEDGVLDELAGDEPELERESRVLVLLE